MVNPQIEIHVRARLAEVARVQQAVDETGWMAPATVVAQRGRPGWRQRVGAVVIRLGAAIAGPAAPLPTRAIPGRP